MKSSIKKGSSESVFIQILKGIFNVKASNCIKIINKKRKELTIKKNELDYFEYTYIS
ncbi:MAG: hypothetical protein ACI9P5_003478 [Saprospiraceae bacterium]|jgi:hypothetical protein